MLQKLKTADKIADNFLIPETKNKIYVLENRKNNTFVTFIAKPFPHHRCSVASLLLLYHYFNGKVSDRLHSLNFHQFRPLKLGHSMPPLWSQIIFISFIVIRNFHSGNFFPKNCYFGKQTLIWMFFWTLPSWLVQVKIQLSSVLLILINLHFLFFHSYHTHLILYYYFADCSPLPWVDLDHCISWTLV